MINHDGDDYLEADRLLVNQQESFEEEDSYDEDDDYEICGDDDDYDPDGLFEPLT